MTSPASSGEGGGRRSRPDARRSTFGGRSRRHAAWSAVAVALVVAGVVTSVLAAGAVGRNDGTRARKSFEALSANVASTLQLAIQHEDDLVVDAGAVLTSEQISQRRFVAWATVARVTQRYPEVAGIGLLELVPNADLPAFTARAVADPAGPLSADGTFQVTPAGPRPFYCLASAGLPSRSMVAAPAGIDYCADPDVKAELLKIRDSGRGAYRPQQTDAGRVLVINTPIYRDGSAPATVEARRAAFVGAVATQLDPSVLLERALRDQPGLSISMSYDDGSTAATFASGVRAEGATSTKIDIAKGWTVQTFGVVDPGGMLQGNSLMLLLSGIAVSVLLGLLVFVLGTGRERAQHQLAQRTDELHHLALHDALTGLPNRALVMDRIERMLVRDRRNHTTSAALFLDLDDFKQVNDTLGHGAGDRLLMAVAERLARTMRGADTIGRMGGDEFVVLLDGSSAEVAPDLVAQRLLDAMGQPFELDDKSMPLAVNVSIGVASAGASGDHGSAEELLRDADVALYEAKGAGKSCYKVFDPEMHSDNSRRAELEFDLRAALSGDQYQLVYQPIYNLDDLTVVGVEALLRWNHPRRGLIGPDEFIPMLERSGHIREVGRWVLQQACQQMATWHAHGDRLDISVNVSGSQLDYDGIIDDVRDALDTSGLDPSSLIVEVTETSLMQNIDATAGRLRAIREMGVRVAVDDFGTGYSSLAYLQQLPVDCLKIDRQFIDAVSASAESRVLVNMLVQLGRDLGLKTLAEGVETPDQMDVLRGAEVDQAQGFLLARPLDPEALEAQFLQPTRPTSPESHGPRSVRG